MKNIFRLLLLFFFIQSSFLFGQTGKISGVVIDGDFNEPMAFANILVKGSTKGVITDFDGKYDLELKAGTYTLVYSFVGYQTKEINDVVVKANDVLILDVVLNTNSLEAIVIKTSAKRNTEEAILNFQKKSVTLLDGLSAQSIKKTGASNLASAVKSIPGVSVQGGKYVYVRGLGDRYTKSILNGVDIPGLDPDRNTIQMDIFPTNILDNVIVIKSASAEYPADFTGGVIDIVTKDFPSRKEASVTLGLGYNPDMHFNKDYLTYSGSATDFFGYDDGTRDLPINRYQPIPGTFENKLLLNSLTNRFEKELAAKKKTSGLNYDFGFTLGNQYDIGKNKLGYQASFSYKNKTTFYKERLDGAYVRETGPNSSSLFELNDVLDSNGSEGINNIILNGLIGVVFKTDKSKYKFNALHIQNGESTAGFYNQIISQDGTGGADEPLVKHALTYTERSITNFLLNGKHRLGSDDNVWNLDWKFSPTLSKVWDKDHRITPLQISENGNFFISPSASSFPIRLWRTLQEENWVAKVDLDKKYTLFGNPAKLKFGGSFVYKFRDFEIDDFTFEITGNDNFIADGNVNNLLLEENLWSPETQSGTNLRFGDQYNPNDSYEGENFIYAAYISNEFNLSENFKTVLGLRIEQFQSKYTGQDDNIIFKDFKVIDQTDFFPSANLIYAVTDNTNIRTSYSRTTARPSFKEQSKSQIFDPITSRLFIGNLDLVTSFINNFDIRYEYFGDQGQMFAISGFYKDFTDPIELTFFESAPTQLTPRNLGNAKVYGAEIELRQHLGFIMADLENLKFNLNASIITSELTMFDDEFNRRVLAQRDGESVSRKRDLQGQSPYLINAGFNYTNDETALQIGLFYNIQGETLEVVGTGIVPDVFTKPFNSFNFTLNKAFGENKNTAIELKITNILNDKKESVYQSFKAKDQIYSFRNPGTEISLGYSIKF